MTITKYHRPDTMAEALALLGRKTSATVPLAGGTALDYQSDFSMEVVDLQALNLAVIDQEGPYFTAGSMVTLQSLLASGKI